MNGIQSQMGQVEEPLTTLGDAISDPEIQAMRHAAELTMERAGIWHRITLWSRTHPVQLVTGALIAGMFAGAVLGRRRN